jgi:hypothetical protein
MGTRSLSATFNGISCPLEIQFGFVHGPSAAVAHIKLAGLVLPPPGTPGLFFVGAQTFFGFVTNREYDPIEDETSVRMVDWRDRLHDINMRCAINMQESDGRYYHIFPQDWQSQIKTYVTRELGQFNFSQFQNIPANAVFTLQVGKNELISAYSFLNWIGNELGINMTADTVAIPYLQQSYPLNLDFNSGNTTIGNAIQSIVQKAGMQFTCYGVNGMHFTIRGIPNNAFSDQLRQGLINVCATGVSSGKIGDELNEQGRRVVVIGDKNRYEYVFACRQNWNPAWTWGMVFGGIELGALLAKNNLTEYSKVGDLPFKYRDAETYAEADAAGKGTLPARKTRNLMTIRDYLDKIAFKAYVVEARAVCDFNTVVEDAFSGSWYSIDSNNLYIPGASNGLDTFVRQLGYDSADSNLRFSLARNLVTDSNLQFLAYATTRNIIRGQDFPFGVQHSLVPRSQGVSLDVEEVMNPQNGRAEYRVRLFFNQPQFWLPPGKPFDDPRSVEPDLVLVRLCLEGDFYMYTQGQQGSSIRVREQTISVRNLYKAFVNNQEQTVLQQNFLRDLEKSGQLITGQGVKADQIAQRIATQLLFHEAITISGSMTFEDLTGFVPDGIIDSVSTNYTAEGGASETINFTSGLANDKEINSPIPVKLSRPFRNEEEQARDRLLAIAREAMRDKAVAGKALAVMDAGLHEPGALLGVPVAALSFAKDGIAHVKFGTDIAGVIGNWSKAGGILVLDKGF